MLKMAEVSNSTLIVEECGRERGSPGERTGCGQEYEVCQLDTLTEGSSWPSRSRRFSQMGRVLSEHERAPNGGIREKNTAMGRCRGPKTDILQKQLYYVMGLILGSDSGQTMTTHCSHGAFSFDKAINQAKFLGRALHHRFPSLVIILNVEQFSISSISI